MSAEAEVDPHVLTSLDSPPLVAGGYTRPKPPRRRTTPRTRRRVLQSVVLLTPLILLATMSWLKRNMYDDGFIYLHVAQQIVAGNGPVFNAGERVEVYTGVLWVAVLALVGSLTGWALEWIAVVTGILMTLAAFVIATLQSARVMRDVGPRAFLVPVGATVFATTAVVWTYASSGLETGLTFLWLALAFAVLRRWGRAGGGQISGAGLVVLGLGMLVRPELALSSALFVLVVLVGSWRAESRQGRARILYWAFGLPLVYQMFRVVYFGSLVANPAIAKEGTRPRLDQGLAYLWDLLAPYWMLIPLAAVVLGGFGPLLRWGQAHGGWTWNRFWGICAVPVSGLINASYVVIIGGDYLHGRLLLPALFAVLIPVFVVPLTRNFAVSLVVLPWALVNVLFLRTSVTTPVPFGHIRSDAMVTAEDWDWASSDVTPTDDGVFFKPGLRITRAIPLDAQVAAGVVAPTLAASGIGLQSYVAGPDVYLLDLLGLADSFTARLELETRGLAGHEKKLPTSWTVAMLTTEIDRAQLDQIQQIRGIASGGGDLIEPVLGDELYEQVAWARAALECPAIADLRESVRRPLTLGAMVDNVVRVIPRTSMRIPPDPQEAYVKFCGDDIPAQVQAVRAEIGN